MPKNRIYRQGVDKVAQAHRGLWDLYLSMMKFGDTSDITPERPNGYDNPHTVAGFHGISVPDAQKICDAYYANKYGFALQLEDMLKQFTYYRILKLVGGRNSAKTFTAAHKALRLSTDIEGNLGLMLRKDWKTVETTIMSEFLRIVKIVTDGNPSYLHEKHGVKSRPKWHRSGTAGFHEYTVYTKGEPSRIMVYPEPKESSPDQVADALKSPEGGLGFYWVDEESELQEVTISTLEDNLRREVPIHAGFSTTNSYTRGTWGANIAKESEDLVKVGKKPRVLILRSSPDDNPYANKENVAALKEKYKNDKLNYRKLILGLDVSPSKGKPVFPDFQRKNHVDADVRSNPGSPLYIGLDWGFHHPAVVIAQPDRFNRWVILDEIMGDDWSLDLFSDEIFSHLRKYYPGHYYHPSEPPENRNVIFWCDPAGSWQSERGNTTIEEFSDYGIDCKWSMDSRYPGKRADLMRKMQSKLVEGKPRLRFHERCEILIEGCEYGYHYAVNSLGVAKKTPNKEGFFEHIFDALGYLLWGEVGLRSEGGDDRPKRKPAKAKGPKRTRKRR